MDPQQSKQYRNGMLLIVIGLLLLGAKFDLLTGFGAAHLWPFILVALGVLFLLFPGDRRRPTGAGYWLIVVGGIFLLDTYDILTIREGWPLFVVAGGIAVLLNSRRRPIPPGER